jgi:hypothetical protein
LTGLVGNEVDKVEWRSSTEIRCGVHREIPFRTWMKDEKRKRLKLEQMEDSMGNGVHVMNGRGEVETEQTTTWRSGKESRKEVSKQQASKQGVGVNEPSFRKDEERLQYVAFGAWPQ